VQLEDAALETRIPQRFLEALETNAPLDAYPAPVYGRAFLREYAQFLGIDPEPLVASFRGMEPPEEVPLKVVRDAVPAPARWPAKVLLGLSVCVVAGLAVLGVLAGRASIEGLPSVGSIPTNPPAAAPSTPSVPATPPPTQPPPVRGIHTVVHLTDRCWLQVVADGKPVFTGTAVSGESNSFHAHETLQMTLGNAGGAQLVVNGKGLPTGQLGQVLHLDLTVQHGRLRVQRV
jgi:cytoskeletal protein RodZ